MAEPPTMEELARRFLDLWQDQVAALAADPQVAAQWRQLMLASLGMSEALKGGAAREQARAGAAPAGAAPAAAASGLGRDDPAGLARRVAALEQRLAAVESGAVGRGDAAGAGGAGRKPRGAAARKRPAAVKR